MLEQINLREKVDRAHLSFDTQLAEVLLGRPDLSHAQIEKEFGISKKVVRRDGTDLQTLLLMTAIIALSLAAWLGYLLNVEVWEFWTIFLAVTVTLAALCKLVNDNRAVRIKGHDNRTIAFAFSRCEYAREFARLNPPVGIGG
jgi:hypothetical protein